MANTEIDTHETFIIT